MSATSGLILSQTLLVVLTQQAPGLGDFFAIIEEGSVEVSTKQIQRIADAPAIVSSYTPRQLSDLGVTTLGELLEFVAAVQMVRLPGDENVLVVRGFGSENGVGVLLDGMPVLDTITGRFAHYDMLLIGLARIEVQRGPGSALHGGNAQVAVINLVTPDGALPRLSGRARGGRPSLLGAGAQFESGDHPFGQFTFSMSVDVEEGTQQTIEQDGTSTRGDLRALRPFTPEINLQSLAGQGARTAPRTRIGGLFKWVRPFGVKGLSVQSLTLFREVSPLVSPSPGGAGSRSALPPEGSFERRDLLTTLQARQSIEMSKQSSVLLTLAYTGNRRAHQGLLTGPLFLVQDRDQDGISDAWPGGQFEALSYWMHAASAEIQLTAQLPLDNRLTIGVVTKFAKIGQLSYQANFENGPVGPSIGLAPTFQSKARAPRESLFILPGVERLTASAFVQDIFQATAWLTLVAGARFDFILDRGIVADSLLRQDERCISDIFNLCEPVGYHEVANGKTQYQLSPRLAAIIKLPRSFRVKALYGRAFTPPPLVSLSNQTFTENLGRAASNPLLLPLISDTIELSLQGKLARQISAELTGCFIQTRDEVVLDPVTGTFQNNAQRQIFGAELILQGELQLSTREFAFFFSGAASLQKTRAELGELLGVGADLYPAFLAKMLLGFRVFSVSASAMVKAASAGEEVSGWAVLDARLFANSIGGTGLSVGLIGRNLLNAVYDGPTPKTVGLEGFPHGGRTLMAVLELEHDL